MCYEYCYLGEPVLGPEAIKMILIDTKANSIEELARRNYEEKKKNKNKISQFFKFVIRILR